jgi:hypothetical protein
MRGKVLCDTNLYEISDSLAIVGNSKVAKSFTLLCLFSVDECQLSDRRAE